MNNSQQGEARAASSEAFHALHSREDSQASKLAGQRVLQTEGRALLALADNLPKDFSAAVELILMARGRVVVSGMGKSGHVGRKIAATLASTGTPAFFVHPSEASHGDLGMLTTHDVALLISNSGETTELGDIITHCARFLIPIIGVSKRIESTLMRAAQMHLTLPDLPEACAIGMAPTTSTTLTIALGDALAIALMERRKFNLEQFLTYHPGGRLGARLATAAQLMHAADKTPLVPLDAPMSEVILLMTARSFGVAGVIDAENRLAGVISDGDLRRNMNGLLDRVARDVATWSPVVISSQTLAAEALALMNQRKVGALFIVGPDKKPLGLLHFQDCLRAGVV